MKSVLVTQSFGGENEYRRAIFMIWSFWAHSLASAKVILFTDRPDYFDPYFLGKEVEYVMLTPSKMKLMRGRIDFLHRMKIAVIEEAFSRSNTSLLYADSDTFFTADPSVLLAKLSPTDAFMHTREYAFEEIRNMPLPGGKTAQDFVALIDSNIFELADGSALKVPTQHWSWNAGAMLFHQSHAALLPNVYALTDQFYPATRNHASEQYAFSIIMQNKTILHSCEEIIYHYWYFVKKQIVDKFLENNLDWLLHANAEEKINMILKWTQYLPLAFDRHIWMLRDQAIQAFHENKFAKGLRFAAWATLKNPFSIAFTLDVGHHIKRWLTGINKNK